MCTEANKTLARRIYAELNKGNLAIIDEVVTADYVCHNPTRPVHGPDELKRFITELNTPFPDMQFVVEDVVAEGDFVVVRLTGRGTHQVETPGVPPTGKQITVTEINIHRIIHGKVAESWLEYAELAIWKQLGVIHEPMEASVAEANKALVRRVYQAINTGNSACIDELAAPNYVLHGTDDTVHGSDGLKQVLTRIRTPFPDLQFAIEDLIAEGDTVVARLTVRGTHQGEGLGTPPTGKQVTFSEMNIHRIVDGQVQESWLEYDALGLLQQVGAIPTSTPAAG